MIALYSYLKKRLLKPLYNIFVKSVQRVVFFEPMIIGPADRLHVSNLAGKNNYLANTNSGHIYIGEYVFFGKNVCLITGTHDYTKFSRERMQTIPEKGRDISIEKGVWLGTNVIVIGPCVIGQNAVVGAGSVVTKNIPPYAIVAGNPAKVIKIINPNT